MRLLVPAPFLSVCSLIERRRERAHLTPFSEAYPCLGIVGRQKLSNLLQAGKGGLKDFFQRAGSLGGNTEVKLRRFYFYY